jgi:YHS domain-containing protein
MKFLYRLSIACAAGSLAVSAFAAPTKLAVAHKVTAKAVKLICPVTGEKIASIAASAGHSTYKGKTYYFCCPSCKPMFDKNPTKYAK